MENRQLPETTPVPRVIKAISEGCNIIANKPFLMLFPLLLDLFLLFGPKLRIENYVQPFMNAAISQMSNSAAYTGTRQLELLEDMTLDAVSAFNLFGLLQTFPIGVNVIFASSRNATPLGTSAELQIESTLLILLLMMVFLFFGVLLGTVYYSVTAAAAIGNRKFRWKTLGTQFLNVILFYIALAVIIAVLSVPMFCLMTVVFLTIPFLYQIMMLLAAVFACWIIIPLFYIPHGIFMKGLDLPNAVKGSIKMASWSSPLTIRFILLTLVISYGLNIIWAIPEQSSWLILISIFGHAFVTTAALASSFIFYRELTKWQNENQSYLEWRKANLHFRQIFKKEPEKYE